MRWERLGSPAIFDKSSGELFVCQTGFLADRRPIQRLVPCSWTCCGAGIYGCGRDT